MSLSASFFTLSANLRDTKEWKRHHRMQYKQYKLSYYEHNSKWQEHVVYHIARIHFNLFM
jgi:hypothetical protein